MHFFKSLLSILVIAGGLAITASARPDLPPECNGFDEGSLPDSCLSCC
ncbi:uncharacterized protein FIBRA_08412 [Fibroporia radiculosa]|uniref:Uncharacterized protein n=1 Tax=Fibroporia radiculosa TaxID=599839 RepID=J4ICC5_9APHY|nr:uncharacterized protein FIBRA_08412 [Fibroporia radiculosa]CCM06171.1 predicted protein [Fibroporia radiculosa]